METEPENKKEKRKKEKKKKKKVEIWCRSSNFTEMHKFLSGEVKIDPLRKRQKREEISNGVDPYCNCQVNELDDNELSKEWRRAAHVEVKWSLNRFFFFFALAN